MCTLYLNLSTLSKKNKDYDNSRNSLKSEDIYDLFSDFNLHLNKIFKDNKFEVKTKTILDTPYFHEKDLCRILEFKKSDIKILENIPKYYKNIPKYDKKSLNNINENTKDEIYLNEGGMYYLIFHSESEKAKEFELFVNEKLFPKIRKFYQDILFERIKAKDFELKQDSYQLKKNNETINSLETTKKKNISRIEALESRNKELSIENQKILEYFKKEKIKNFLKKQLIIHLCVYCWCVYFKK